MHTHMHMTMVTMYVHRVATVEHYVTAVSPSSNRRAANA